MKFIDGRNAIVHFSNVDWGKETNISYKKQFLK